ncbi:MAG: VWA domain-containing protein, partial [Pseudomonadota bacterium]
MGRTFTYFAALGCAAAATFGSISTASAQADRSVEIVLDVSSSMAKRLPNGTAKISAAREGMTTFVRNLPVGTRLALRAYGHQSPDRDRNCRDTELIVDFEPAPAVEQTVIRQMRRVRPRGYSPISFALRRAARDIAYERAATHMLVLVSDGKETCDGDPCAMARQISRKDARLVIHTIGFNVGSTARDQLQCVARVTGGSYYDARDAIELADRMTAAYGALPRRSSEVIVIRNPDPGTLTVTQPGEKHLIREVESGDILTAVGEKRPTALLPPGIYNVTFGNGLWKSVEVAPGRETVLRPGTLEIEQPSIMGHRVIDAETGAVITEITPGDAVATLVPDRVNVQFGKALWSDVEIRQGERTTLTPGIIRITNAQLRGTEMRMYPIFDTNSIKVAELSLSNPEMPLPPGQYTLDILGRQQPIEIEAGKTVILRV